MEIKGWLASRPKEALQDRGQGSCASADLSVLKAVPSLKTPARRAKHIGDGPKRRRLKEGKPSFENHVVRHMLDIEAVHTFEGTETIQALTIGRDITGVGAL